MAFSMVTAFVCGVFVASFVSVPMMFISIGMLGFIMFIGVSWQVLDRAPAPLVIFVAFVVLSLLFGMWRTQRLKNHLDDIRSHYDGTSATVVGYILQESSGRRGVPAILMVTTPALYHEKVVFDVPVAEKIAYGETYAVHGIVSPVKSGASQAAFALNGASIQQLSIKLNIRDRVHIWFYQNLYKIRDRFLAGLTQSVPEPHAAFLAGILIGSRSTLPEDIKNDFNRTSTSHIIAVSGFNITIIISILGVLLTPFLSRKASFLIICIFLLCFMLLTGAQASVVRATVMGLGTLIARQFGRLARAVHILVLTAGFMILANPFVLRFDIGFQLSFAATFGILVIAPLLDARLAKILSWRTVRETFSMTIAAQLAVLPLLLYYFKTLSLLALPVNLIVVPLVPIAMLLGFVTAIAGMLSVALGTLCGYASMTVSWAMLSIIHWFSDISWSVLEVPTSWHALLISYGMLAILLIWLAYGRKKTLSI